MKAIKPCFIKSFCLLSLLFLSLISFLLLGAAVKVHLLMASGSLRSPWADGAAFACRCCCGGAQLWPGRAETAGILQTHRFCNSANPQCEEPGTKSLLSAPQHGLAAFLSQGGRFLWLLKAKSSLSCAKSRLIQEMFSTACAVPLGLVLPTLVLRSVDYQILLLTLFKDFSEVDRKKYFTGIKEGCRLWWEIFSLGCNVKSAVNSGNRFLRQSSNSQSKVPLSGMRESQQ